jgi:hypothetical protein
MVHANLPKLPRILFAAGLICAAVPLSSTASPAQTSDDQISQFATCQERAAGQGIEQEAFGKFITQCMAEVAPPTPSSQDQFDECRSQARARENDGELYSQFLHMCMATSPSDAAAAVDAHSGAAGASDQ